MGRNIAVILGHPAAERETLGRAMAEAYIEGARRAGHEAEFICVGVMDIPFLTGPDDYKSPGIPADIRKAQEVLRRADHWVIIYPLWLGTMPAKLKAFFEWALCPGFAYEDDEKGAPHMLLGTKTARIIVTMGMPAFVYRFFFMAHSLKSLERNILKFVGIRPVRHTIFGMAGGLSVEKKAARLARVAALGERGA